MENLQTIIKNIAQAKRVAIVLPEQLNLDALCAGFALQNAIKSGSASLFTSAGVVPQTPFLSVQPQVHKALGQDLGLSIKVSNSHAEPGELRYEKVNDGLVIVVTPSTGEFIDSDVSVLPNAGNFDLVIILGAASFEQLGKIYTDNAKLFFETPKINIDTDPSNEYYGTVNLVNATATSLSEAVMEVIEAMQQGIQSEVVATSLLAGIISQTNSFRDPKTNPSALQKASRLVSSGAKQQDIIQHLFKTKPLPLLQLWGRALARLTAEPDKQALSAVVTSSDLEKTQVAPESFSIVLRDIVEMVTGYSIVSLLAELPQGRGIQVLIAGLPHENLMDLSGKLSGTKIKPAELVGKYEYVSFLVSRSLAEVQQQLGNLIQNRNSAA